MLADFDDLSARVPLVLAVIIVIVEPTMLDIFRVVGGSIEAPDSVVVFVCFIEEVKIIVVPFQSIG